LLGVVGLMSGEGAGCDKSVTVLRSGAGTGIVPDAAIEGGKIPVGSAQCSDGIDNDGDGLIDYDDPECVGPLDNDESTFATGIPGDNVDPCKQDCFFDGNSGMGDDRCSWQLKCDPLSTEGNCPYDPSYAQAHATECSPTASQPQACLDACQKLTPNGCDCFGCCAFPGAAGPIRLAATCTAHDFADPTKCPPCTQVTECMNTCDRCELCVGKTTLPADCATDGGALVPSCGGDPACGPGTGLPALDCPVGTGCLTGCCRPLPQ